MCHAAREPSTRERDFLMLRLVGLTYPLARRLLFLLPDDTAHGLAIPLVLIADRLCIAWDWLTLRPLLRWMSRKLSAGSHA